MTEEREPQIEQPMFLPATGTRVTPQSLHRFRLYRKGRHNVLRNLSCDSVPVRARTQTPRTLQQVSHCLMEGCIKYRSHSSSLNNNVLTYEYYAKVRAFSFHVHSAQSSWHNERFEDSVTQLRWYTDY